MKFTHDEIPKRRCPRCGMTSIVLRSTGNLALHNVAWTTDRNGVQWGVKCLYRGRGMAIRQTARG